MFLWDFTCNKVTRSKKLTDMFSDLNLRISYEKVTDIKKDVANGILEKLDEINGVFVCVNLRVYC